MLVYIRSSFTKHPEIWCTNICILIGLISIVFVWIKAKIDICHSDKSRPNDTSNRATSRSSHTHIQHNMPISPVQSVILKTETNTITKEQSASTPHINKQPTSTITSKQLVALSPTHYTQPSDSINNSNHTCNNSSTDEKMNNILKHVLEISNEESKSSTLVKANSESQRTLPKRKTLPKFLTVSNKSTNKRTDVRRNTISIVSTGSKNIKFSNENIRFSMGLKMDKKIKNKLTPKIKNKLSQRYSFSGLSHSSKSKQVDVDKQIDDRLLLTPRRYTATTSHDMMPKTAKIGRHSYEYHGVVKRINNKTIGAIKEDYDYLYDDVLDSEEKIIDESPLLTHSGGSNDTVNTRNTITDSKTDDTDYGMLSVQIQCTQKECNVITTLNNLIMNENHIQNVQLSQFLHLISKHDDHESFESIYNKLGDCNIKECEIFRRNYRNRNRKSYIDHYHDNDIRKNVNQQIIDKIHCYYHHSYDIGHRLNRNEINMMEKKEIDDENDHEDNVCDSKRVRKLNNILSKKHKIKYSNKFTIQLDSGINPSESKLDTMTTDKMYSYGFEFIYEKRKDDNGILVTARFQSLKEEITQNPISALSINQFYEQSDKSQLHFDSDYRRSQKEMNSMTEKQLLSVMIYCNYDELQRKFTESYRKSEITDTIDDIVRKHSNFYWLGRLLKEATTQHGTLICNGSVQAFFHGISEELIFPRILTTNGVKIYGPTSTSSSYIVATNFTAVNNGLVIEFADGSYGKKEFAVKYFSCGWLSDHKNEDEFLFIHLKYGGLKFVNIRNTKQAVEFYKVLDALRVIKGIVNKKIYDNTEKDLSFAIKIIQHQLSIKRFKRLHHYAQNLINTVCNNIKEVTINWKYYTELYQWMSLENIIIIFPNLETITIINASSILSVQNDFTQLCIDKNSNLKILYIENKNVAISCIQQNQEMQYKMTLKTFKPALRLLSYFINLDQEYNGKTLHPYVSNYLCRLIKNKIFNIEDNEIHYNGFDKEFEKICHRTQFLKILWKRIKKKECQPLFSLLCCADYDWIHLDNLNKLFPHMQTIEIGEINLCDQVINAISKHIKSKLNIRPRVTDITIICDPESKLSVDESIKKYQDEFINMKYRIDTCDDYKNAIRIKSIDIIDSVIKHIHKKSYRTFGSKLNKQFAKNISYTLGSLGKETGSTDSNPFSQHTTQSSTSDPTSSTTTSLAEDSPAKKRPFSFAVMKKEENKEESGITFAVTKVISSPKQRISQIDTIKEEKYEEEKYEETATICINEETRDYIAIDDTVKYPIYNYAAVLMHILDSSTDIGVAIHWYTMNEIEFFILTISCVALYRIVSGTLIWYKKGWKRGVFQFLDIFACWEIYESCVDYQNTPTDTFKWITKIKATFESFPQGLIQITWILKSQKRMFPLIIISTSLSVYYGYIVMVKNDKYKFGDHIGSFRQRFPRYLFRMCEILSRMLCLSLLCVLSQPYYLPGWILYQIIFYFILYHHKKLGNNVTNVFFIIIAYPNLRFDDINFIGSNLIILLLGMFTGWTIIAKIFKEWNQVSIFYASRFVENLFLLVLVAIFKILSQDIDKLEINGNNVLLIIMFCIAFCCNLAMFLLYIIFLKHIQIEIGLDIWSAVQQAVNDVDVLRRFTKQKHDSIHKTDSDGKTTLMEAAVCSNVKVLLHILHGDTHKLNQKYNQEQLYEYEWTAPDIFMTDIKGRNCIYYLLEQHYINCKVRFYNSIQNERDLNKRIKWLQILRKYLIEKSQLITKLVNVIDKDGRTSLHHATKFNNKQFVSLLLELGTDPNICDNKLGETAMHIAIRENKPDIFNTFIEWNLGIIKRIIPREENQIKPMFCDWNSKDNNNCDVISACIHYDAGKLLTELLINKVVDIKLNDQKNNILQIAIQKLKVNCVTELLKEKSLISVDKLLNVNIDNKTALDMALLTQNKEIIIPLIDHLKTKMSVIQNDDNKLYKVSFESLKQSITNNAIKIGNEYFIYLLECLMIIDTNTLHAVLLLCSEYNRSELLKLLLKKYKHNKAVIDNAEKHLEQCNE